LFSSFHAKLADLKAQPVTELILVQDWFEELKRLVPHRTNNKEEAEYALLWLASLDCA